MKRYAQIHITHRDHNRIFPNRKTDLMSDFKYFIDDEKLIVRRYHSILGTAILILVLPINIIVYGISSIPEYMEEIFQDKYKTYTEDICHRGSDSYNEVAKIVKHKKSENVNNSNYC